MDTREIQILLVEDSPPDVDLTLKSFKQLELKNRIHVVNDGEDALKFLRKEGSFSEAVTPDLILLDLNLPKVDGREVLEEVKKDPVLQTIPIVVLTNSDAEEDILKSYKLSASCFITKPIDLDQFRKVVQSIGDFWFSTVKLPPT